MGPRFAATAFKAANPTAARLRVTLYGTLAATGRGHLTDLAVSTPFSPTPVDIVWLPGHSLPLHPNGMQFEALDGDGRVLAAQVAYSVGGGALLDANGQPDGGGEVYPHAGMDAILDETERQGLRIWEIVDRHEGPLIWSHLASVWKSMQQTIATGLNAEGRLPGTLNVPRKASAYHARAQSLAGYFGQTALQFAYALAVSEENAAGGEVVTAPTCGACGVLPAVLFFLQQNARLPDEKIHRALATAGMIGNIVKRNASISGAEVGCQARSARPARWRPGPLRNSWGVRYGRSSTRRRWGWNIIWASPATRSAATFRFPASNAMQSPPSAPSTARPTPCSPTGTTSSRSTRWFVPCGRQVATSRRVTARPRAVAWPGSTPCAGKMREASTAWAVEYRRRGDACGVTAAAKSE